MKTNSVRVEIKKPAWMLGILMLALMPMFGWAQDGEAMPDDGPPPPPDMEKFHKEIEARKIGFLTSELELTPEEAQKFWPVYNKYEEEMDKLRDERMKAMHAARKSFDEMTDKEIETMVDEDFNSEQAMLDIKKKYHSQFKSILPIRKVAKLYHAEDMFKKKLLREIGRERRGGMHGPPPHGGGDHHEDWGPPPHKE
ncbi:MAG: hypothetical protein H6585_07590 [Flavobacteriales bacterium]|nr:hypothetical protein [Flavobacteriales bacterium]MCB9448189.1 hypothetical protein [Flavobacteriales bacterium]